MNRIETSGIETSGIETNGAAKAAENKMGNAVQDKTGSEAPMTLAAVRQELKGEKVLAFARRAGRYA
jgi:hypothetical protein